MEKIGVVMIILRKKHLVVFAVFFIANFAQAFETNNSNNTACKSFHPGHQFLVADDNTRNADGLQALKFALDNQDVHNFNGFVYQIDWGMLESSQGKYDWTRLDEAVSLAQNNKKYIRIRVEDRTFWKGCNVAFIPAYVAHDSGYNNPKTCFAKIWEKPTMDSYIAVVTAVAKRYANNPHFMGITVEETATDSVSIHENPHLYVDLYAQLERLATEVHKANPNIIFRLF